jgi:threonine dehydrogenase-like Zn-dependent dehydrogenase
MITHRFPFEQAAEAFDLLYNRLGETMGVILVWSPD